MLQTILITFVAVISVVLAMGLFGRKNQFEVEDTTAIVTGGSQGLGLSIAKQLASKGANVVIVAQTVSKLEAAIKEVETHAKSPDQKFKYLSYDLRSPDSAPKILEEVETWNNDRPADIVFNCAGNCIPGFFASSSVETLRSQMDTVYWTSAYMAHAALNSWTRPAAEKQPLPVRHLVFTASVLAFLPLAGYAPYNPAKAAMRSLADTLNQEIAVYNGARSKENGPAAEMKVHIAFPMGIKTPGFENEEKLKPALTKKLEEDDKPQEPDDLAKILISELEAGQYMLTSATIGHLMKGFGFGGSQKSGLMDHLWTWVGSMAIVFVGPDFMSKCRKWGQEKGMAAAK